MTLTDQNVINKYFMNATDSIRLELSSIQRHHTKSKQNGAHLCSDSNYKKQVVFSLHKIWKKMRFILFSNRITII